MLTTIAHENKIRKDLYMSYVKELNSHLRNPIPEEQAEHDAKLQLNSPYIHWIDICFGTKPVGFLTVGLLPTKHEKAQKYILHIYVTPTFRRKHLATSAIKSYLKQYPCKYCLDVANGQNKTKKFWDTVFTRNGYNLKSVEKDSYSCNPEMTMYIYKPKKELRKVILDE